MCCCARWRIAAVPQARRLSSVSVVSVQPYRQRGAAAVLYGTLLVLGLASGWQVWQAQKAEATRQVDAELITLAGHQRMQSQRIGRLAALAAFTPRNAQPHLAELQQSQTAMRSVAKRMGELIERQRREPGRGRCAGPAGQPRHGAAGGALGTARSCPRSRRT